MCQHIQDIIKEIDIVKKNQIEKLELKSTINEEKKCTRQTQ